MCAGVICPMVARSQQAQSAVASQPAAGQASLGVRAPKNAAEFDELFHKISNWGRWGKDDELGAAHLITDAKRKQAASLVRTGISVSLAHDELTEAAEDNQNPFEHVMNRGFQTDTYRVNYHGYGITHLDALCHILYKDQTFNGHSRAENLTEKG